MPPDQASTNPPTSGRSTFVTVVAWVFITFAGFATFISLLQAFMFFFVFPASQLRITHTDLEGMPSAFQFLWGNIQLFLIAFWSLSALTLVSAIGLLHRKNWARLVFVVLMVFGIVWNLGGIWLQQQVLSGFSKLPPNAPPHMASGFGTMTTAMTIAMSVFAIVISLVFAWIVKRLVSRSVKAEFNAL